jgi:hypothetical protein
MGFNMRQPDQLVEIDKKNILYDSNENKEDNLCLYMESTYYDYWCQHLTESIPSLVLYPKVLMDNLDFHEVILLIFDNSNNLDIESKEISSIINSSSEIKHPCFRKPSKKNNCLISHFLVSHKSKKTITSFFHEHHSQVHHRNIHRHLLNIRKGRERWIFSGEIKKLEDFKDKIESTYGHCTFITTYKSTKMRLTSYYDYFKFLGSENKEAEVLSRAMIIDFLKRPDNEELQYMLSKSMNDSLENVMYILDRGLIRCSWILDEISNWKKTQSSIW